MPIPKKAFGPQPWVYPQPLFLVGTYGASEKPNLMAAAWGGIISSDPVCLSVSIRPSRLTYQAILEHKAFTVSIPDVTRVKEADYMGLVSGRRFDKFTTSGLTPIKAEKVHAPYVDECPVAIECSLLQAIEVGVHTAMIGKIEDVKVDESILDETGSFPDPRKFFPLAFSAASGTYHTLGEVVGKSFSEGKLFLKK